MRLNNHLHAASRLRISGALLLFPLYDFMVCTGTSILHLSSQSTYGSYLNQQLAPDDYKLHEQPKLALSTPLAAPHHLSSNELTPEVILLLDKLTVAQLIKKFTAFHKMRMIIASFDVMTADAGQWRRGLKFGYALTKHMAPQSIRVPIAVAARSRTWVCSRSAFGYCGFRVRMALCLL